MNGAGPAEGEEREIPRVESPLSKDRLDSPDHIRFDDPSSAADRVVYREKQAIRQSPEALGREV